jgi:hypothetical protein
MKVNWEHILQNKYNYLLMTQIIILVVYPILQVFDNRFPIISLLLLIALAPALWVGLSRKIFIAVMSLGALGYLLNVMLRFREVEYEDRGILILLILYGLFYFLAIMLLIKKISSDTIVTSDTIKGGISIYILLGFFWAVLYMIVLFFEPNAMTNIRPESAGFDCYYYSFITLTTLGYGDIAPVAKYARILAILEAVVGPVYLAIFVAQIIGLNIAQKLKE